MRLRITRNLLEESYPHLTLTHHLINSTTQTSALENFIELKRSIRTIESTGLFPNQIQQLKDLDFFNAFTATVSLQNNQLQSLVTIIDKLSSMVADMIEALNQLIPSDNGYTLSIKIPTPNSFNDISDVTKSLDLIFKQTLSHPSIGGNVEILNFDMGSYWIDILVSGGANVMNFIAAIAWGGAVTYKKIQEGRLVQEQVRELKISNKSKEELSKGLEKSENTTAQNEANFIANQFYKDFDSEDVGRIKFALKEIAKLYSKGAEMHPSLEAPKEIKDEFPKMNQINTIDSKIKQIGETSQVKK